MIMESQPETTPEEPPDGDEPGRNARGILRELKKLSVCPSRRSSEKPPVEIPHK
jgi:hypothetical protein